MDDLESVSHNSDGLHFLTSVSAVELHRSNQSLNDGAKCFSKLLGLISAGSVGDEYLSLGCFGCDIINEAGIFDLLLWNGVLWFHRMTILRIALEHFQNQLWRFYLTKAQLSLASGRLLTCGNYKYNIYIKLKINLYNTPTNKYKHTIPHKTTGTIDNTLKLKQSE